MAPFLIDSLLFSIDIAVIKPEEPRQKRDGVKIRLTKNRF